MELRLIRYGMCAGFGFLLAIALIEWIAAHPGAGQVNAGAGSGDGEITAQVWQVLAEARRILEESA